AQRAVAVAPRRGLLGALVRGLARHLEPALAQLALDVRDVVGRDRLAEVLLYPFLDRLGHALVAHRDGLADHLDLLDLRLVGGVLRGACGLGGLGRCRDVGGRDGLAGRRLARGLGGLFLWSRHGCRSAGWGYVSQSAESFRGRGFFWLAGLRAGSEGAGSACFTAAGCGAAGAGAGGVATAIGEAATGASTTEVESESAVM